MAFEHEPVMLRQVVELLAGGARIADCTLGLGGYAERILSVFPETRVFALDRDPAALEKSMERLAPYGARFAAFHASFGSMESVLAAYAPFDGFVFDLGVSNMQLTEAGRGFSFQSDGPLDMRMNPGEGQTAAEVLAELSAEELENVFRAYGEERYARLVAAKIVERRKRGETKTPRTTGELTALVREALPAPVQRKMGTHPARRVFQALRIYVNDELGELKKGLESAKRLSSPEAVAVVVSYHSLEDRIVKHTFRAWEKEEKRGFVLTRHPLLPDPEEVEANFKARSAKLRAFRFGRQ